MALDADPGLPEESFPRELAADDTQLLRGVEACGLLLTREGRVLRAPRVGVGHERLLPVKDRGVRARLLPGARLAGVEVHRHVLPQLGVGLLLEPGVPGERDAPETAVDLDEVPGGIGRDEATSLL